MNVVKRAIIMAAGTGNRMHPVTFDIPKPLIKVNGTRMIDTIIDGLYKNGIYEIYIVVGYLKEQFYELKIVYPGIHIIENPYYLNSNNISSLYVARSYLEDVIIIDGDQIVFNADILSPYFEQSGYNAIWTDKETNEWLMQVENDHVVSCSRVGGKSGWQLFSISRWSKEDGKKLKKYVEFEFVDRKNRDIYWDDVVMFCHFNAFNLGIREMKSTDIIEIDSFEELITIDHSYEKYEGDFI